MIDIQNIRTFADLAGESFEVNKPVVCLLGAGVYSSLMEEVVDNYLGQNQEAFLSLKIKGTTAIDIQYELALLKLPTIIIFYKGKIKAVFQDILASHELSEILKQLND